MATALRRDYARAGVPMLPVVIGAQARAWVILAHALAITVLSLLLAGFGMGWIYLAGAAVGGAFFTWRSACLALEPTPPRAMANFHASLIQLTLLLGAAIADRALLG